MALAGAASSGFGQEPMNIADIVKEASNFDYDAEIPLRYWIRTADAIYKQAQSYERDGNGQDAYLFYMRHALLASEKLPKHLEWRSAETLVARKKLQKDFVKGISSMEGLKPRIDDRYEKYTKAMARRKSEREKWAKEHTHSRPQASLAREVDLMSKSSQAGSGIGRLRMADTCDHHALALSVANEELRQRETGQRSERQTHGDRPQADGIDDDEAATKDLSQRIIAVARRGEQVYHDQSGVSSEERRMSTPRAYNYPSVPSKTVYNTDSSKAGLEHFQGSTVIPPQTSVAPQRPPKEHISELPPQLPPKERDFSPSKGLQAPPRPDKISLDTLEPPSRSPRTTPDLEPRMLPILAWTESGKPLRTVYINPDVRYRFLKIALPNTNRNLETCGILCGTLIRGAFFISKLVIPEQESTSDTCDTVNEEALFDYCDQNDLMTLGWIHTHPTQSCFLSSRDMHTHSGYQVQLAESVAIVCAPKQNPSYGVFRLTDPPGLKTILNCRQSGLFHPHAERDIYTSAAKEPTEPGHVQDLAGLQFEVVDLRPANKR